ncbi:adhesion G-protein coupled receptor G2 isoform X4 [Xenopus laevis]|uniref:Adhesion G-protein coupled receptor G2 n=1 Tax=Xenopus laevis TaxID=8355 RepID=A0A8J1M7S7_XENLA|nr:adhesion G-protein coupled receptor G2 isoform X4 [Xenopus laevis]
MPQVIRRMVVCDACHTNNTKAKHSPANLKTVQLLCFSLFILAIPQIGEGSTASVLTSTVTTTAKQDANLTSAAPGTTTINAPQTPSTTSQMTSTVTGNHSSTSITIVSNTTLAATTSMATPVSGNSSVPTFYSTTIPAGTLYCAANGNHSTNNSVDQQYCNASSLCNGSAIFSVVFNTTITDACDMIKATLKALISPSISTVPPTPTPTPQSSTYQASATESTSNSSLGNSTGPPIQSTTYQVNISTTEFTTNSSSESSTAPPSTCQPSTTETNSNRTTECQMILIAPDDERLCRALSTIKNITENITVHVADFCCCQPNVCLENSSDYTTLCNSSRNVNCTGTGAGTGTPISTTTTISTGQGPGTPISTTKNISTGQGPGTPISKTTTISTGQGPGTPISKTTTISTGQGSVTPISTITTNSSLPDLGSLNEALNSPELNSSMVDSIVSQIEQMFTGEVEPEKATQLVDVMNTFLNLSENLVAPVSKRLIGIVDKITLQITISGQSINITSPALVLAAEKVNASLFNGAAFGVKVSSDLQVSLGSNASQQNENVVFLPGSLLNGLSPTDQNVASRVQFNFFEKTSLFVDPSLPAKDQSLVSTVISASVSNLTLNNLKDNVTVLLQTSSNTQQQENVSMLCVFWNFNKNKGSGGWDSSGCSVLNTTVNQTICTCNHLTSFAILMGVSQLHQSPEDTLILTFISYIGCGLSAIFLSVTFVTYIAFEKIRRDYPSKILIQLCAALIFLNLSFLINPWIALYNNIPGLCISAAAFLHYFLLVSITWMGLEAFHMYLSLVKVFNTYVRKYILKFCIIGWGFPAVVVAIILAVNKDLYGFQTRGHYPNGATDDVCWMDDIIFYITVVGYYGLIFLLTISMFIVVILQLCRIKKQKQLGFQKKITLQDMRSVAGITFLLGITWGLGFFTWGPGGIVIVYLFTIFNTLQGFFIFIFYCVAKENVRKQWKRYLCCGKFRLAENSDWSKANTWKLKKQASKQGASSSSSSSIQSSGNTNSTTLLVSNEYSPNSTGNGTAFKERNGVSFMLYNREVPIYEIPVKSPIKLTTSNERPQPSVRRTSKMGNVHFMDQM